MVRSFARYGRRGPAPSIMAAAAVFLALAATAATPGPRSMVSEVTKRPEHVGQCFSTRVLRVQNRLGDGAGHGVPGTGSAIAFTDGHYNNSYAQLPGIDRSRPGDRVRLCVVKLPTNCPKGDTRGILYRGWNLRTGLTWTTTDTEHICGGA
jgi:hypothetical protein